MGAGGRGDGREDCFHFSFVPWRKMMMNSYGKSNFRQPMQGSACTLEQSSLFLFEQPGGEGIFVFFTLFHWIAKGIFLFN